MIQTEIDRIEDGKAFLRGAIIDKTGGEVPTQHQSLDDYAQIINNIDLGGVMTDEVKAIVNRTATTVTVPSTVTYLRVACFYNCSSLQEIVMLPTTPPTQGLNWCENTNNCPIYVPDDSLTEYQTSWSTLASRIQALSTRTKTYDFTNATEDNEVIPTDSTKSRTINYIQGGNVRTMTGWMTTEYDGLYLTGGASETIYYCKRLTANGNGITNKAVGNRAFSIDTKGYNTITLHNAYSNSPWTSDSLPYVDGGTITVANDGMSATITVNQGATKVDVTTIRSILISSMVFTM